MSGAKPKNFMNITKSIFISILFVPLLVFAQNQAVLPNAGITPESPFYFLDKFGEALRTIFTLNPESKAHLQITFAAERISEIKVILETKGIEAKGLEVAQSRLRAHLANTETLIADEKARGKDVSRLAKELDDEFEVPKTALEQTFKDLERALETKEKELKAKIRVARQDGDTAQVDVLVKEFMLVKTREELLDLKKDDQEKALEKENERIEKEIEAKAKAEKAIQKAEKKKAEMLAEASREGMEIPTEAFANFDNHLVQAKDALVKSDFEGARHHAKEAKESLEDVDKALEHLENAKEIEEELKDEEEDKLKEVEKEQENARKEEAKREAKKLKKEREQAREELKRSEKMLREAGKVKKEDEDEHENKEERQKRDEEKHQEE